MSSPKEIIMPPANQGDGEGELEFTAQCSDEVPPPPLLPELQGLGRLLTMIKQWSMDLEKYTGASPISKIELLGAFPNGDKYRPSNLPAEWWRPDLKVYKVYFDVDARTTKTQWKGKLPDSRYEDAIYVWCCCESWTVWFLEVATKLFAAHVDRVEAMRCTVNPIIALQDMNKDRPVLSHSVVLMTLKSGAQYVIDFTAAQYGFKEWIIPLGHYREHYLIPHPLEIYDKEGFLSMIRDTGANFGWREKVWAVTKRVLEETLEVIGVRGDPTKLSNKDMAELKEQLCQRAKVALQKAFEGSDAQTEE